MLKGHFRLAWDPITAKFYTEEKHAVHRETRRKQRDTYFLLSQVMLRGGVS